MSKSTAISIENQQNEIPLTSNTSPTLTQFIKNKSQTTESTPLLPIVTPNSTESHHSTYDLLIYVRNMLIITSILCLFIFFICQTTKWPIVATYNTTSSASTSNMIVQSHYTATPLGLLGQRPWS